MDNVINLKELENKILNKKPKKIIEYNGIKFDSDGELYCYHFLTELKEAGYIDSFSYQPKSFNLSDKVQYPYVETKKLKTKEVVTKKQGTLLNAHEYTTDFKVIWIPKAKGIFYYTDEDELKLNNIPFIANHPSLSNHVKNEFFEYFLDTSYIEIKPGFDKNGMTRLFTVNQKWVYQKYGIYVQKITPIDNKKSCLFKETFVPEKCLYTTKTKKLKSYKFKVRTLKEFLNEKNII
jgi:hypothetical protein